MSWISNYVRPKIRALVTRQDIPDDLWEKCPECGQMIFHRELEKALKVCTHCGHHMRIGPDERMRRLFDDGQFTTIELPETIQDPLRFRDRKRYGDRLREARSKTDAQDAIQVAHGRMGGQPVVIGCFNFAFMGGSMGIAVGEGLLAAAKLACMQEAPLIAVPASGGARMQEGILSLMQMPRTTVAVDMVKEQGLPYVVLLTDPTTGGVSASFAMLGDLTLAEPGAVIGFAGQRVIEATVREQLPEGFQRAEYLRDHGMVDQVVDRRELRDRLIALFGLLCKPTPEARIVRLPEGAIAVSNRRVAQAGPRIDDGRPTRPEPAAAAEPAAPQPEKRSSWSLGFSVRGRGSDKSQGEKGQGEKTKAEKAQGEKAQDEKAPDKEAPDKQAPDKQAPDKEAGSGEAGKAKGSQQAGDAKSPDPKAADGGRTGSDGSADGDQGAGGDDQARSTSRRAAE